MAPRRIFDVITADLTPELRALLDGKLDSFVKLELVLTLRAAGKPLSVDELALQLQVGREALRPVVHEVVASGIIEQREDNSVQLKSGKWDPQIEEAASIYAADPARLMKIFTRIAMARIRGMGARTFADAFRIRKKGD